MTRAKTSKTPPTDPKDATKDAGGGKTKVEQGGESAPRLPHERDQSSDSQETRTDIRPRWAARRMKTWSAAWSIPTAGR
jgi:hypothetical protein